ncbi:nascent polypeptide-associated complex subunit alpha, muscle-specific form-like isoform X10 [Gadus macrocephalus]|uniref:nascent polypeptide-associated complex subunit alpha, muscle-specific form-like isoform X10 n=1 Tax=Gadus macrocephalus TaxID=80720 RepID=UPI0028CB4C5B|nr:nascent polypeptide-associated complex subunit alpha, muscle-specific form-like isoform X10 [Gadus macrocephalus]
MEGNGEMSDTDSGIILHSVFRTKPTGSDSPTTTTKDVTTHTRAMKLKHQSLQERLQRCVLELKKLCIREAELTGELSADYPLSHGESPPKVRRRIGASFQLDVQSIPRGQEQDSPLSLVDSELALQLKIYEAARRLCREEHQSKAVRRSRLQQSKREEKRVKELQETAFRLRLQHGRSSPLPAFNVPLQELGNSDDSSLSDSPLLDEEVLPPPPPSSGPPGQEQDPLPQSFPASSPASSANSSLVSFPMATQPRTPPVKRTPSQLTPIRRTLSHHTQIRRTPSLLSPSQLPPGLFTPGRAGSPGLDSMLSFSSNPESEAPPIQPSPWSESSLDQPFQKTKKNRSSTKSTASSPASSQVLPPLEACLGNPSLPQQLAQLQLCDRLANGSPTNPEPRLHRHLSLRISNPEAPLEERRGRPRSARRRLTDCSVTTPDTAGGNPADQYGSPQNPAYQYGSPQNPAYQYGSPQNPEDQYGTPDNPADQCGTPENPADQYGSPQNPADQYGSPQNPADQYEPIEPETAGGSPASHYGTPENAGENPVNQYGSTVPETTRGYPEGLYGPPENLTDHYGPPETTRNSEGQYGPPETMRYPPGHYGPPESTRGYPPGHYGPPETPRGYPPFRGNQANSEDGYSDHCSTPRSGSVCQEPQRDFPRARPFQHPGPQGGPGVHPFQGPGLYHQGPPRYQSGPSFNPHHYPGDVAYARNLDLFRGYHGPQAAPNSRRDYMYAEAPPVTGPRRAPQEGRLARTPSLWEPQRYRSDGGPPPPPPRAGGRPAQVLAPPEPAQSAAPPLPGPAGGGPREGGTGLGFPPRPQSEVPGAGPETPSPAEAPGGGAPTLARRGLLQGRQSGLRAHPGPPRCSQTRREDAS